MKITSSSEDSRGRQVYLLGMIFKGQRVYNIYIGKSNYPLSDTYTNNRVFQLFQSMSAQETCNRWRMPTICRGLMVKNCSGSLAVGIDFILRPNLIFWDYHRPACPNSIIIIVIIILNPLLIYNMYIYWSSNRILVTIFYAFFDRILALGIWMEKTRKYPGT